MSPRGLKIALGVSLLLNAFLLAAGGTVVFLSHREMEKRMERNSALYAAASALPADVQARLKTEMRAQIPLVSPDFDAARAARRNAARLAAAPTFDRAAVEAAMAQARAAEGRGKAKVEAKLFDFMAASTPDVRAALAPALAKSRLFGGKRCDPSKDRK